MAAATTVVPMAAKLQLFRTALLRNESDTAVLNHTESGYTSTTGVGVSVTVGASATVAFTATVTAVTDQQVQELDSALKSTLSQTETDHYQRTVQQYSGGLNIPLLSWFGINAGASYSKENVDQARSANTNYDTQAKAVSKAMSQLMAGTLTISGTLTATGLTYIPTEAEAYIKVAQLYLNDGRVVNVVSTSGQDVQAATSDGTALPTSGQKITIKKLT